MMQSYSCANCRMYGSALYGPLMASDELIVSASMNSFGSLNPADYRLGVQEPCAICYRIHAIGLGHTTHF